MGSLCRSSVFQELLLEGVLADIIRAACAPWVNSEHSYGFTGGFAVCVGGIALIGFPIDRCYLFRGGRARLPLPAFPALKAVGDSARNRLAGHFVPRGLQGGLEEGNACWRGLRQANAGRRALSAWSGWTAEAAGSLSAASLDIVPVLKIETTCHEQLGTVFVRSLPF